LHGFQYIDWQFDGNDIIAVSRTAFEDERGLPVRQHDANYFLFHRFTNFRGTTTEIREKLEFQKIEIVQNSGCIYVKSLENSIFNVYISDITGKVVFSKNGNLGNTEIITNKLSKGMYLIVITQNNKSFTKKIII